MNYKKKRKEVVYIPKVEWKQVEGYEGRVIGEAYCGRCHGVLYGADEVICPVCGAFNDWDRA